MQCTVDLVDSRRSRMKFYLVIQTFMAAYGEVRYVILLVSPVVT